MRPVHEAVPAQVIVQLAPPQAMSPEHEPVPPQWTVQALAWAQSMIDVQWPTWSQSTSHGTAAGQ
jgi:hypothetical protein